MSRDGPVLGLHTDLYEVRMVESYLRHGLTGPATFSLFVRPSAERPWLVAAGLDHALDVLEQYRFGPAELDYLRSLEVPDEVVGWFAELEPEVEVRAVEEGTVVLADEPLLEITAPLPVAQLLETALLNALHLDTLVATKAARCVLAAGDAAVVDFGFRRAHGLETGNRAARAAWIGGCAATSNLEAGRRYGIPVLGTMAHSFVQAFEDEAAAFRAFARDHPDGTTLLVDTYDTVEGVRRAVALAGELADEGVTLGGVRLDSGPLDDLARQARKLLDEAGLGDVRVVASGGLDEYAISDLIADGAPIDGFGLGSSLVTSADKPALDIVYKLVAYEGTGRAKYSAGKRTLPGEKQVLRPDGPETDVLELRDAAPDVDGEPLLVPVWSGRTRRHTADVGAARRRVARQLGTLPTAWRDPRYAGDPPRPRLGPGLRRLVDDVEQRERGA